MIEVKQATPGRIVHYFPNGADDIAATNNADFVPAIVVQAFSNNLNLQVFTMHQDAKTVLRYSIVQKPALGETPEGEVPAKGRAYWDWPAY